MGIKGLDKVIKNYDVTEVVSYVDLRDRGWIIAFDAMAFLYMSHQAVNEHLTSADGRNTSFLSTFLAFIREIGYRQMIWVFDSPKANPNKKSECDRRRATKARRAQLFGKRLANLTNDTEEDAEDEEESKETDEIRQLRVKMEKSTKNLPIDVIRTAQRVLDCFGIPWIEAPMGIEAEAIASHMTTLGIADVVFGPDRDCIAFGATTMMSKVKGKTGKFNVMDVQKFTREYARDVRNDLAKKATGITPAIIKKADKEITDTTTTKAAAGINLARDKMANWRRCADMLDIIAAMGDIMGSCTPLMDQEIVRRCCVALGCDWNAQKGVPGIGPRGTLTKYGTQISSMDAYQENCVEQFRCDTSEAITDIRQVLAQSRTYPRMGQALVRLEQVLKDLDFNEGNIKRILDKYKSVWRTQQRSIVKAQKHNDDYTRRTARGNSGDQPLELEEIILESFRCDIGDSDDESDEDNDPDADDVEDTTEAKTTTDGMPMYGEDLSSDDED